MKDSYYADKRDLVKWGALVHLACRHRIKKIVQVGFLRSDSQASLSFGSEEVEFPTPVWKHFRSPQHIEELGRLSDVEIDLFDTVFEPVQRQAYVENACSYLRKLNVGKIVLLDPDTGIEPDSGCKSEHISEREVSLFWQALAPGDWLVIYQHKSRQPDWSERRHAKFRSACNSAKVVTIKSKIAADVVLFAARR